MLFVLDLEWVALVVYELDLELAEGAVLLGVLRVIDDLVLGADGGIDGVEVVGHFADEAGCEEHAAGHAGKRLHLVVGLEVVHIAELAAKTAATFAHDAADGAGGDGEDGDVGRFLDLVEDLVEGDLGEGVAAGGDEDDVLLTFNPADAVEPFVERVKDIGLGETGDTKLVDGLKEGSLILGEVGDDLRVKVEGHHGDIILRPELLGEGEGGVAHVVDEVVVGGGKFADQESGDGCLNALEADDFLLFTVLEDLEVGGL